MKRRKTTPFALSMFTHSPFALSQSKGARTPAY